MSDAQNLREKWEAAASAVFALEQALGGHTTVLGGRVYQARIEIGEAFFAAEKEATVKGETK